MTVGWLVAAIAINVAAAGADVRSTQACLSSGRGREANPVMASGRLVPVKASLTATITAGSITLWKRGKRKQAIVLSLVPAAVSGAAAIHNRAVCR